MKAYNVLDPASPIYGKIFIEASAGTGKTFAIEHMVLRLILKGMCITEILVVTFTKAGALDLKTRIHTSLLNLSKMIREEHLELPYLQKIENKDEAILLIENACALSSEMPVCTIHSFAFGMLSSFAFEGGVDFDLLHFEDEKNKDVMLQAILDTMRAETDEETISAAQVTKMMDLFQRKLSTFTKKVGMLIDNEKDLSPPPTYSSLLKAFLDLLEETALDNLGEELEYLAPLFKRTCNRQKQIHHELFSQIQMIKNRDLDGLVLSTPSIIELLQEDNLKKGAEYIRNTPLLNLTRKLLPIYKTAKDPLTPITHIAVKAKKRLEEMNVKGPDAILASMKNALSKPLFKEKISKLFKGCIIDEFQDTDPLQWDILSSLFFDSAKVFCTVGDPKQSIYAFRGADLPTYLSAKQNFDTHLSLDTNFRSHEKILTSLNYIFSEEVSPGFLSFEEHSKDLRYHLVKVGKKSTASSKINLLLCPPPKKKTVRTSLSEAEQLYFFPHIIETIKKLDIDLDKMAILVKDRYQGLAVSLYLSQMNIPAKANISASLLDSSLFSLFETLLFLAYSPRSESLLKKLLSHQMIDAPLDLLKEDLSNPILQKLSIDFTLLGALLEKEGLHAFLFALIDTKIFAGRSLGEILCKEEDSYLTMMQVFSLFLSHFDKDPKLFISEIRKLDPDVFSFLKKGCGTDKKSVTIMTSHLSKGLEFEAVFALSLYTRMKQTPETEDEAILIDKEKMRLLYVTLTRSKTHLYIYGTLFGDAFPLARGCGSPLELFLSRVGDSFLPYKDLYKKAFNLHINDPLEKQSIPTVILTPLTATPRKDKVDDTTITIPEKMPYFPKGAPSLSFSSLPFAPHEYKKVEAEAFFPYGSKVGNQIHLIFEKIMEEGLYTPFTRELVFPVVEKSFFATDLEGFEEIVFSKIEEIFTSPFNGPFGSFTLESIPPNHLWGEVLFHYKLENSSSEMKGFADLIALFENKYYIIDWKCNHLEGYSKEHIKNALEAHNYTKQAAIYSRALKSFLEAKNLSYETHAGGAFYVFVRGGKEGIYHFTPDVMKDEEVLCMK